METALQLSKLTFTLFSIADPKQSLRGVQVEQDPMLGKSPNSVMSFS